VRYHNGFRLDHKYPGKHAPLVAIAEKALGGEVQTLDTEYALYAGVLQGMTWSPSAEDAILAERCLEALSKRFPDSWFQPYAQAALMVAHLSRAQVLAKAVAGQERPLSYSLGIALWLDEVKATGVPGTHGYRGRVKLFSRRSVCPVCGSRLEDRGQ
jgi:hypothetical protein